MSELADLLDTRQEDIVRRWMGKVEASLAPGGTTPAELRDHVPEYLGDLVTVLREADVGTQQAPEKSPVARAHGRQRLRLGFDLEALVREFGVLRGCLLDLVEEAGCRMTLGEFRILTDFLTTAVAEAVSAYTREREASDRAVREANLKVLAEREAWLATTLSSIGDAVIATDAEGHITFINPAAAALTGWSREGSHGLTLSKVFPIIDARTRAPVPCPVRRVLDENHVTELPAWTLLVRPDGREIPVEDSAAPIRDAAGAITGVVLVFRDVTLKRDAEAVAERHSRHSLLVAEVGEALTRVSELRPMLQRCAEALVQQLGAAFARIWLLEDGGTMLQLEASAGLYTHLDGPHGRVPVGQFKIGCIAQERRPHLTNDVLRDPRVSDPAWARREGMVAFAGYPLLVADRLLGVVGLFSRAPLPDDTLEVLQQVADSLALGVERLHVQSDRQRLLDLATRARAEADAERQKLNDVFMQAYDPICILEGPEHTFTFANPAYRALVGGRDLVGKALLTAVPEVAGQGLDVLLDRVLSTGEPYFGNEIPIRLEGQPPEETVMLNFVYSPKRNTRGEVDGVLVSAVDVTEQVRARQRVETLAGQLRQSEERLRRVVEASRAGTWEVDLAAGHVLADPWQKVLMGLAEVANPTLEQALGAVHPEDRPGVQEAISAALAGREGGRFQGEYRSGSAPVRWLESRGQALFDAKGKAVRLVGTSVEVTARKEVEDELRRRATFEQHLLGIVSHDLRNPLNAILLSVAALGRRELDSPAARNVLRIQSAAERATRMIRDLLDFTQARLGGGITITRQPTDLRAVVRTVLDEVEATHPARELEVAFEGDARGEWDSDRVAQVVQNLVTNALKYSPEDTLVRLFSRAEEGWVCFCVHSWGEPIPPEKLPNIFEPLQRATTDLDPTGRSVGLGLYIVKQLVAAHGGTTEVSSTREDGTTFTVKLPASPGA